MAEADFTQNGKLILLNTKLGGDKLLVTGVVGQEAISQPFSFRLELLSPDHDLKPEDLIGSLAKLLIARSHESAYRPFNGFFHSFSAGSIEPKRKELRRYRAELVPWFSFLKHNSDNRVFQDKTVAEILDTVLNEALERHFQGASFRRNSLDTSRLANASYPKLDYCVQYNETDFNFASRLMEEYGIFYFFEQSSDGHRMILCPDRAVFGGRGTLDAVFGDDPDKAGGIFQWTHRFEHRTGRYTQTDYNYLTPTTSLLKSEKSKLPAPRTNPTEQFYYPGRYAKPADGKALTLVRIEEEETKYHLVDGSSTYAELRPGITFNLTKHAIKGEENKSYVVTGVSFLAAEGGYTGQSTAEKVLELLEASGVGAFDKIKDAVGGAAPDIAGMLKSLPGFGSLLGAIGLGALSVPWVKDALASLASSIPGIGGWLAGLLGKKPDPPPYTNTFTCVPIETPLRPIRVTPKPQIRGPQTAKVIGPEDEEIWTDEHGRIKVKFFWDRSTDNDKSGDTSCFIRVAQLWAGEGPRWGAQFIPRIGQEVIVEFLDGDPDRPVVTGALYNGVNKTAFELTKYKTQSGLKTQSTPAQNGKDKFHMLRFDDASGAEQVLLRSQRRLDIRAYGSFYETNHANRHAVIGWKDGEEQGGDFNITVNNDVNLHVNGGIYERTEKDFNLTVVGNTVMDLQGSQAVLVGGKSEHNAREIIIEAATKISLKVGSSAVVLDPTGVTIVGPTVKINSGGSGTETGDPTIEDPLDAAVSDTGEPGWLEEHKGKGGGGRRRRQLRSQHYIAPPRPGEPANITALRGVLQHSAAGRHALEVYDRYNVQPATGTAGGGTFYDPTNNQVTMDPTSSIAASDFVHEMNHAEAANEGRAPDPNRETRDEYVNHRLQEEARGDALGQQAHRELAEAGHPEAGNRFTGATYDNAYNRAATDYRAAHPGASAEEVDSAARSAAEQAVLDDFRSGRVPTSNTGQAYPDYYGSEWDAFHPAGGGTPAPGGT